MGLLFPWCPVVFGVLSVYVSHVVITAPGELGHRTNLISHREGSSDGLCCV